MEETVVVVVSQVEDDKFCPKRYTMKGSLSCASENVMYVYVLRFIRDLPLFLQRGTVG